MSPSAAVDDLWSNLPADLLGAIYNNIASPLDRVRFKAVSGSWRAAATAQRPAPTFPWLVLSQYEDGTAERVFCPMDGALLRVALPHAAAGKRLVGCHDGGWIAATSDVDGDCSSLVIVNLFSGIEVLLSDKQRATPTIRKLVFSEAPTSKKCILAANLNDRVAVCRVGCRKRGWSTSKWGESLNDIAFCHGKLYGRGVWTLFVFDICMTKNAWPMLTVTHQLNMNLPRHTGWVRSVHEGMNHLTYIHISYLVKHRDRLFMALRVHWFADHESLWTTTDKECFFKVFELIHTDDTQARWQEITTLGHYAFFLSATCSRVVHVPTGRRGGIEKNRIYYNHRFSAIEDDSISDDVHLGRCDNGDHLYHIGEHNLNIVDGVKSVGYYVAGGSRSLGWLLPPDF